MRKPWERTRSSTSRRTSARSTSPRRNASSNTPSVPSGRMPSTAATGERIPIAAASPVAQPDVTPDRRRNGAPQPLAARPMPRPGGRRPPPQRMRSGAQHRTPLQRQPVELAAPESNRTGCAPAAAGPATTAADSSGYPPRRLLPVHRSSRPPASKHRGYQLWGLSSPSRFFRASSSGQPGQPSGASAAAFRARIRVCARARILACASAVPSCMLPNSLSRNMSSSEA